MGMAASQARWISLAARKSNVEYEGQQINQARTALANQSAELWNQLYKMDVPTAPSTTDYTTTQYTFTDGDSSLAVTDMKNAEYTDSDGLTYNKYVTYSTDISEYIGIRNTKNSPQVQYIAGAEGAPGYYMVGTKKLTCLSEVDRNDTSATSVWGAYRTELDQIVTDWPESQLAKDWINYRDNGVVEALNNIYLWKDISNNVNFTSATSPASDGLEACCNDQKLPLHSYCADFQTSKKEISKYGIVEFDSSGRATSVQFEGSSIVYGLQAASITDENAYNDAMNQYNYEQQVYEKKVQDINAKTEQIQTEDRTLELRLKQLDTEQSALQTEMEAVKKVISKNIEGTFKTFES